MTDNETLKKMRDRWQGLWRIWRSTNYSGDPGEWCATRLDPAAGLDATVMCPSAGELDTELIRQGGGLATGETEPPAVASTFGD